MGAFPLTDHMTKGPVSFSRSRRVSGLVQGTSCKRFQPPMVFFVGLGSAFLYQGAMVVMSKYFKKRLALSTAIARSGMGLTFLLAPFAKVLIDLYDWSGESF